MNAPPFLIQKLPVRPAHTHTHNSSNAAAANAKQTIDGSTGGGGGFSGWQPPSSSPFLVDAHDVSKKDSTLTQSEQQP